MLNRRHTSHDVANLKQYPERKKEDNDIKGAAENPTSTVKHSLATKHRLVRTTMLLPRRSKAVILDTGILQTAGLLMILSVQPGFDIMPFFPPV